MAVLRSGLPTVDGMSTTLRKNLRTALLLYCFRLLSAADLDKFVRLVGKETGEEVSPTKLRASLVVNGTVLRNLKLFAYAVVCNPKERVQSSRFWVPKEDARYVRDCLVSSTRLLNGLRAFKKNKFVCLDSDSLDKLVCHVMTAIDAWMGKFINKKFLFIMQSDSRTMDDLKQEFAVQAIYALYRMYPEFSSLEHAVNIAKSAIHNHGINLIEKQTTQSRSRYVNNPDGTFESRHVPLHDLFNNDIDGATYSSLAVDAHGANAESKHHTELQRTQRNRTLYNAVIGTLPVVEQQLVYLWSGQYDENFTTYLGEDNELAFEKMLPDIYMTKAAKFLGVTRAQAMALSEKLRDIFV
jgi:hypothetical protein